MKKIIITGSTGFVGNNLSKYLVNKGIEIAEVNREMLSKLSSAPLNLNHDDVLVHLAGKAHDLKKTMDPSAYYTVNYQLTADLYDAFLRSDAKKFIFVSSVKASADTVDGILTEEEIPNPLTDYGKSKLQAEDYIRSQPLPDGKTYYILRPCMIHGPGNKGNLNLLFKFVQKGIPYPLASFTNKRSFLSVENLCFVITELINQNIPSGIYNVADDQALSTNEVVSLLANASGKEARLWRIPVVCVKALARIGDLFKLPITSERLSKLTENYIVSNKKIKSEIGKELPRSSVEGLTITAVSFKD